MIEVSLQGFQDLKAWDSPLATFDSYQIPYLMQKHHRRRFPTSRPDHSFTAKLLCCAAHLEKAAWSRGHGGGSRGRQLALHMKPLRTNSQASMPLPSQSSFLTSACIGRCLPSAHASAVVQKAPRQVTFLFPSTVTYSSFCFIHCSPPEHFPFRATIFNIPPRTHILHNERMVRRGDTLVLSTTQFGYTFEMQQRSAES